MQETAETVEPKAERSRPPRPKGRAKKGTVPADVMAAEPFPKPPRATEKYGMLTPEQFWGYRKLILGPFQERVTFYVNRAWPVEDHTKNLTAEQKAELKKNRHKRIGPPKYAGQYVDIPAVGWEDFIFQRHGQGSYKLYLNDTGVRGNPNLKSRNICKTIVHLRDKEYPAIMDLSLLDLTDPANASFIEDLRQKGIAIPGDVAKPGQEEGEDMAAVEKLTDALVEQSKLKAPDNSAAVMLSDLLKQSETRHLKELELAEARHARDMEAINKRLEAAEKSSQTKGPTTTQEVIEMAKAIRPEPGPPADNGMVTLLTQMLASADKRLEFEKQQRLEELKMAESRHAREMEALNKRLEAQETRAAELEKARLQQAQTQPGKSAIKDAVDMFRALRGATDELSSESTSGTGNPWVDLVADNLPRVLDTVGNVVTAMKPPVAPVSSMNNPSGAALPAVQQQQTAQQPQDTSEMGMLAAAARLIKDPLLHALQNQVPGSRFGGWIIVNYGEGYYQTAISEGEAGMLKFLQSAPEVWGAVIQFGAPKVQQFITEFLNGPASLEQAALIRQMVGAQQQQQATPQQPIPQAMPTPSAGARQQQQQPRPVVVDASPAPVVEQSTGGARKIIRPDGTPVSTKPNGAADTV